MIKTMAADDKSMSPQQKKMGPNFTLILGCILLVRKLLYTRK